MPELRDDAGARLRSKLRRRGRDVRVLRTMAQRVSISTSHHCLRDRRGAYADARIRRPRGDDHGVAGLVDRAAIGLTDDVGFTAIVRECPVPSIFRQIPWRCSTGSPAPSRSMFRAALRDTGETCTDLDTFTALIPISAWAVRIQPAVHRFA
jgi:hypothetical protein